MDNYKDNLLNQTKTSISELKSLKSNVPSEIEFIYETLVSLNEGFIAILQNKSDISNKEKKKIAESYKDTQEFIKELKKQ